MAYNVGWDESQPDGSENANTLDTELQELKESVRERMEDIFPRWSDDSEDPKTFDRVSLSLTSDETIADATETEIPWDQADYETDSDLWTSGTDIVIQATGFYLINLSINWDVLATAANARIINIYHNSANKVAVDRFEPQINSIAHQQTLSWQGTLTAADTISALVYQDSGGNFDVVAGIRTFLRLVKLA